MTNESLQQTTNQDDAQVQSALRGIVGKRCWQARLAYGGELHLHLGARVPYRSAKLAGRKQGSWRLGTCGTPWRLTTPEGSVGSDDEDQDRFDKNASALENGRVAAFRVDGLTLTVVFTNNCELQVSPDDDNGDDVPYWELFMPGHRYLAFGPGNVWSFGRSDVPKHAQDLVD